MNTDKTGPETPTSRSKRLHVILSAARVVSAGLLALPKTRGRRQYKRRPIPARFWEKVDLPRGVARPVFAWAFTDTQKRSPCWRWTGAVSGRGYGTFRIDGRSYGAHVVAWLLATDIVVPPGMEVCHTCDVPSCCYPAHLFLGTRGDNMRDAAAKGRLVQQHSPERRAKGEQHGRAKLCANDVREIRSCHQAGAAPAALAKRFNVTRQNIRSIVRGKSWAHAL